MENAEFEVWQDDMPVAASEGPRDAAWRDICHYAAMYGQDGPVEIREVVRYKVGPDGARIEPPRPARAPGAVHPAAYRPESDIALAATASTTTSPS